MSYALNNIYTSISYIRNCIAPKYSYHIQAYKIALRYVYFTSSSSSPEHNLFLCRSWFGRVFFFQFSVGILYQRKETAQCLSTKCRFCSNNASECRGNGYSDCNIPFPIQTQSRIEIPNSPFYYWKYSQVRYVYGMEYAGCVYIQSSIHFVDNSITHTRTHTNAKAHTTEIFILLHTKRHLKRYSCTTNLGRLQQFLV